MNFSSGFEKENQATGLNAFDAKLLGKVVAVASQLKNSHVQQAQSTFNIMLFAYYKISCAMSTREQLLSDPKYPTLIKKLSLLPIEILVKLSINQEVFDLIDNAIKLKCLHLWKIGMRARVANLKPMDLIKKRDFALILYWQVLKKRSLRNSKAIVIVEEESDVYIDPRKSFFQKWRLVLRQSHCKQRLEEGHAISKLTSLLKRWRLETASRIYRRYHLPRKVLTRYLVAWRTRLTRAMIQCKSAEIYNDMRLSRQALLNWYILFDRIGKIKPKAERLCRKKLLMKAFERWRDRSDDRSEKKRLFSRWRSRFNGYKEAEMIGVSFYKQKQLLWIKKSVGRNRNRIDHLSSLCNRLSDKKEGERGKSLMKTWRTRVAFNAEKIKLVDEWRVKRSKKTAFKSWSKKSKKFAQADAYYNVTLAKRCLRGWNGLELSKRRNRDVLDRTFHAWIRHLRDLRSTKFFYGRVLAKRFRGQSIPNNLLHVVNSNTVMKRQELNQSIGQAACWQLWRKRVHKVH